MISIPPSLPKSSKQKTQMPLNSHSNPDSGPGAVNILSCMSLTSLPAHMLWDRVSFVRLAHSSQMKCRTNILLWILRKPYLYFSSHSFQCLLFLLSKSSAVNCCSLENCSMRSNSLFILSFVPINANSWGLDWANISIIDSCLGTRETNTLRMSCLSRSIFVNCKVGKKTFTAWELLCGSKFLTISRLFWCKID